MENELLARVKDVLKNYKDIPLDFVVEHVRDTIQKRAIKAFHVNKHIPQGYEDQGAFNLLIVTALPTLPSGGPLFVLSNAIAGQSHANCAMHAQSVPSARSARQCFGAFLAPPKLM